MDFLRFIESRDIREYLKNIGYQPTAEEAAFVVWYCKSEPLEEKLAAWEYIIATMPSFKFECCNARFLQEIDFHDFLQSFIDLQTRELKRLIQPDDTCLFQYSLQPLYGKTRSYEERHFLTYEQCRRAALMEIEDEGGVSAFESFQISKQRPDADGEFITRSSCWLTPEGAVSSVNADYQELTDLEHDIDLAFENMWVELPTPFHAGDIVHSLRHPNVPFVLLYLPTWSEGQMKSELPENERKAFYYQTDASLERHRISGDISDMYAVGYGVGSCEEAAFPKIYHDDEYALTYLDLEMHRAPLERADRILHPVSTYLKREADIELLLNLWWAIVKEEEHRQAICMMHNRYRLESLESLATS